MKKLFVLLTAAALGCLGCTPGMLRTELVAEGFDRPVFVISDPNDASRLFVLEQITAQIKLVVDGSVQETPFLDLDAKVSDGGGERGLFSLAFHPQFSTNGRFFVAYSNNSGATVVEEYSLSEDPSRADSESGRQIISVPQPFANHNGGMIAFGPDGYLYVSLGDGGSANDPQENGQNLLTLLGTILRIDIDSGEPYAIPDDNPSAFVDNAQPEIWAYGLRNPWRFSFDRETGDLYIADVGQFAREEIDFQPATSAGGENYGWNVAEGFACLGGSGDCGTDPLFTPPIHDYSRPLGQSVTGGYVYRGAAIPELDGVYFFADFVSDQIWSLRQDGGEATDVTNWTADLSPRNGPGFGGITSFGQDADGELYITGLGGGVYKIVANSGAAG